MSNNATPILELYRHIDRLVEARDAALKRAVAAEAEVARLKFVPWEDGSLSPVTYKDALDNTQRQRDEARAEVARLNGLLEKRPEPYTPRVGDVVLLAGGKYGRGEYVVVGDSVPGYPTDVALAILPSGARGHAWDRKDMTYIRPATPSERAAAGLPVEPVAPAQPQVLPEHLAWMEADAAWACSSWSTDFDAPENKKRHDEAILAARALSAAVARRDGGQK